VKAAAAIRHRDEYQVRAACYEGEDCCWRPLGFERFQKAQQRTNQLINNIACENTKLHETPFQ
jgi:hypothetical protein